MLRVALTVSKHGVKFRVVSGINITVIKEYSGLLYFEPSISNGIHLHTESRMTLSDNDR